MRRSLWSCKSQAASGSMTGWLQAARNPWVCDGTVSYDEPSHVRGREFMGKLCKLDIGSGAWPLVWHTYVRPC